LVIVVDSISFQLPIAQLPISAALTRAVEGAGIGCVAVVHARVGLVVVVVVCGGGGVAV